MSLRTQVTVFKAVAIAEALSWAGLLVGMYLKHVAGTTELGVEIFGPIHGGVFLAYVGLTLLLARRLRWSPWVALAGLACSVPPFATVGFEVWAARTGRLDVPEPAPAREPQPVG
jgi:RND superfamily putative drug exporter